MSNIRKSQRKTKIRKSLYSKWSLKKPLYLNPSDKRYKYHYNQLTTNGFSDSETWTLYFSISEFILPRLIRFREITNSHPIGMSENEWKCILDDIIFSFDWIVNNENLKYHSLSESDVKLNWIRYENGMKLFTKWFRDLWW